MTQAPIPDIFAQQNATETITYASSMFGDGGAADPVMQATEKQTAAVFFAP